MIDEVPAIRRVPQPGWTGRMVFRQVAALYSRKDQGPGRGSLVERGWLGSLAAGAKFAGGCGRVPRIHGAIAGDVPRRRDAAAARAWRARNCSRGSTA